MKPGFVFDSVYLIDFPEPEVIRNRMNFSQFQQEIHTSFRTSGNIL